MARDNDYAVFLVKEELGEIYRIYMAKSDTNEPNKGRLVARVYSAIGNRIAIERPVLESKRARGMPKKRLELVEDCFSPADYAKQTAVSYAQQQKLVAVSFNSLEKIVIYTPN